MGYRELLKRYMCFVESSCGGDNLVERLANMEEPPITRRDIGELRSLAAEIGRERQPPLAETYNQRFEELLAAEHLDVTKAALVSGRDPRVLKRYLAPSNAKRHLKLPEREFHAIRNAIARAEKRSAQPIFTNASLDRAPAHTADASHS